MIRLSVWMAPSCENGSEETEQISYRKLASQELYAKLLIEQASLANNFNEFMFITPF